MIATQEPLAWLLGDAVVMPLRKQGSPHRRSGGGAAYQFSQDTQEGGGLVVMFECRVAFYGTGERAETCQPDHEGNFAVHPPDRLQE